MRKVTDESVRKKILFNTVCKVEGKCCKLIVYSGSTDNLVSTKMVEKLMLRKTVHLETYRFAWLQKGHQALGREQCEVNFQIGIYQDEVRCDIIEMDACHILLVRPYKFDREVVHEGKEECLLL